MGNKQELKIYARSQEPDLIAVTEVWWDNLNDWNAVTDGYILFRKDRSASKVVELLFV